MADTFVIDSCAFIALSRKEAGWEKVNLRIEEATDRKATLLMHNASVAEVYYDSLYYDASKAVQLIQLLTGLPIRFIPSINYNFIMAIGFYKTHYKVSFADCFVLATAEIYNATIITSDHHEFDPIEKEGRLRFEWIR